MRKILSLLLIFCFLFLVACKDEEKNDLVQNIVDEKPDYLIASCEITDLTIEADIIAGAACYSDQVVNNESLSWSAMPIRHAQVELLNASDQIVATAVTDELGIYRIAVAQIDLTLQYRLRVLTKGGLSIEASLVKGALGLPYAGATQNFLVSNKGQLVDLIVSSQILSSAFNIYDQIITSHHYLLDGIGLGDIPSLNAVWYAGSERGSFYCPAAYISPPCDGLHTIHLLGSAADSDAFDDAVVLHEIGHFILNVFSEDDSPGGIHYLHDNNQDLRLSWSEGFATAFSSMVRRYAGIADADAYADTDGKGVSLYNYALEVPTGGRNVFSPKTQSGGMAGELAVSVVLWDLIDAINEEETFDTIAEQQSLWDTLQKMKGVDNVSMQDFMELWQGSDITSVANDRSIFAAVDDFESMDAVSVDTMGVVPLPVQQQRTFHNQEDEDWLKVYLEKNTTYRFKTSKLFSGADTVLTIYAPDAQTEIATADNISSSNFASVKDLSINETGFYYVKVGRSQATSDLVRYGSYKLDVY